MPSGSKKRKSSKKSQPQGDPPELEAGLGEAMGNAREAAGEASPSPKGIQEDPEAIAERGLDGNGVNGGFLQERDAELEPPKEDSQTDEGVPAQDAANEGDPPSRADPEPEIPAVNEPGQETVQRGTELQVETPFEEPAASPAIDLGGETAQRETEPQIDAPFEESEAKTDATPEGIKAQVESDALSVVDAPPDTSPDEIKPDADIRLDEVESSKESIQLDSGFEPNAGMEESFVKSELRTDAASADIESPIDKTPDEYKPEMDVPVDATPYIELEAIKAPEQVPEEAELATDEAPAAIKSEALVEERETAMPANNELETEEALQDRELVTDVPPTDVTTETEVIEEPKTAAAAKIEPETEEAPAERELVTDAAPTDVETDLEETQVENPEAVAPVDIKPEPEDAPMEEIQSERELATDAVEEFPPERELAIDGTTTDAVPEMDAALGDTKAETVAPVDIEPETEEALEETPAEGKLETDAVEEFPLERELAIDATAVDVEPETNATAADIKAEMDTAQVQTDSLQDEAPSEIDVARPENESDRDVAAKENESEADAAAAVVESEPPTEESPVEIELDVDAMLDKTEQDEVSQAEIEAKTPEPEPELEALVEGEPEVYAEDVAASEPEPKVVALVEGEPKTNAEDVDVSRAIEAKMEPSEETQEPPQIEPELVMEGKDEAKPGDEALVGTTSEDRGSVEGEVETTPEIHPEPEVATTRGIALEDEAEALPEAKPELLEEAPAEADLEEKGLIETEPVQQDFAETEPDQSGVKEDDRGSVEGEGGPPPEICQEPEVATTRGIELEDEAEAPPEAKPELVVEALDEADLDEKGLIEIEPIQQDVAETKPDQSGVKEDDIGSVEEEGEAPPEIRLEPEVATTRGIELEDEPEAKPELVVEAPEAELDEKGLIETEPVLQDLAETKSDQSGVKEDNHELEKQEVEAGLGDFGASASEGNQPFEPQPQAVDTLDVPVAEDEPPAVSAFNEANLVDDSTSSTSSSETSNDTDKGEAAIEQEPEEDNNIPPSATTLEVEGESTIEVASENQDSGGDIEQTFVTAVDNEQGTADELLAESREDISKEQERAVDVEHDDAESANGPVTGEQGLPTELPLADVEESSKVAVGEQERGLDVGHGEDGTALQPSENGDEVVVSSGQELGIELPIADVVDVEEFAKEGPPPSDQEPTTEPLQPCINEQDMSIGLAADAEPPSVEFDRSLNATLPASESKMTSDAPEPQDEIVAPTNDEKLPLEHEHNLEAATCEVERDNGEDEAALSTVAEAGSVFNDFDERASYEQDLPTDFPSSDQDVDIPECKASDGDLSTEAPEFIEMGLREQFDSEPSPAEKVDATAVCGLEDTSEQPEALLESAESAKPAEDSHPAPIEETPSDELLSRSPQPEQVIQDSGRDEVSLSKEDKLANEEPNITEEERPSGEDDKAATNSILGTPFPNAAGDELISKAFTYMGNGKESSKAPSNELGEHRDEQSIQNSEANNMDKAEIHAMYSKEWKEAEDRPRGVDTKSAGNAPVESAPLISEDRDIKDVYRQQSTQEASLPVVISGQDRDVELVNVKNAERPSGGGTLKRRTKLLDCCGMFDLLLRKN